MVTALRSAATESEWEERRAEILSVRTTSDDKQEFFVHWDQFNKRLDEWIPADRVVLSKELELPRPKPSKIAQVQGTPANKQSKGAPRNKKNGHLAAPGTGASPSPGPGPSKGSLKRKLPHDEQDEDGGEVGDGDEPMLDLAAPVDDAPRPVVQSKQEEIEKLRTSGSMTQSLGEIARVKNLNRIQIGKHEVEAWYFSPYPREFAHAPLIYICEFCLGFADTYYRFFRHRQRCTLLHPPGNEIYRHEDISFFEIDGKKQPTWCRNLSLLSKLFLDQYVCFLPQRLPLTIPLARHCIMTSNPSCIMLW